MSPAARKIKQLRSEALEFTQSGELQRALEKLAALESLEPNEPDWPRRMAECHRQLGQRAEQLEALSRAARSYVDAGMVVKAMAICKMMLALDPKHPAALSWMGKLEVPLGVERVGASPAPVATGRRPLPPLAPPGRQAPTVKAEAAEVSDPQQLLLRRGLIAVARDVARKTGRNARFNAEVRVVEQPAPASPPRATRSSGNWQAVDDAELIEEVSEAPSSVRSIPPATISLPPLSVDAELHHLVPGSSSVVLARGKPSGMFRLAIDEAPPTREEQAARHAREVLPAVPLFSEVDPITLEGLIRQSRLLHFEPGAIIVRQDDLPDSLYVVVNGSVALVDQTAADLELYRLGENEFFGESALISNEPISATVRACEACDLLAFDRDAMRACIASNPSVVPVLLRFLRSRMVEHLVRTSPLFVHFPTAERRALARKFEFMEVENNAVLIQQGERPPGLFVLLSGAVDVTRTDNGRERWLATLERGGVFGEMSLLRGAKAMADVRSVSPGFALMMPASAFREVIVTHPPFLEVLMHLSEERGQSNQRRGALQV